MRKVLIVEDNGFVRSVIKSSIAGKLGLPVLQSSTYERAKALIQENGDDIFVALLDLNLPDAPDGEIVDYVLKQKIPAIVFTAEFSEDIREAILSKNVIDYVIKDSPSSFEYVVELIGRISRNKGTTILLVDDSRTSRRYMSNLLALHQFTVFEASSGREALSILHRKHGISLVITDYNMPEMDGFQLTRKIREDFSKDELSVIGVSAYGNNLLSARFIKGGANDFISKPFVTEEFLCRVYQNIDIIEHVRALKEAAAIDFLTGLFNRRQLLRAGTALFTGAQRSGSSLAVVMIDIDFFKNVNDSYGHDGGDIVLRQVAQIIRGHFRNGDIVARTGGEEFCVLLADIRPECVDQPLESLRKTIQDQAIYINGKAIHVTCSIGASCRVTESLDSMISRADSQLYVAKREGRNCVRIER